VADAGLEPGAGRFHRIGSIGGVLKAKPPIVVWRAEKIGGAAIAAPIQPRTGKKPHPPGSRCARDLQRLAMGTFKTHKTLPDYAKDRTPFLCRKMIDLPRFEGFSDCIYQSVRQIFKF
jgi:hypothetical protein